MRKAKRPARPGEDGVCGLEVVATGGDRESARQRVGVTGVVHRLIGRAHAHAFRVVGGRLACGGGLARMGRATDGGGHGERRDQDRRERSQASGDPHAASS